MGRPDPARLERISLGAASPSGRRSGAGPPGDWRTISATSSMPRSRIRRREHATDHAGRAGEGLTDAEVRRRESASADRSRGTSLLRCPRRRFFLGTGPGPPQPRGGSGFGPVLDVVDRNAGPGSPRRGRPRLRSQRVRRELAHQGGRSPPPSRPACSRFISSRPRPGPRLASCGRSSGCFRPERVPRSLPEALTSIRPANLLLAGQTVLIVLDQFEQWLHSRRIWPGGS